MTATFFLDFMEGFIKIAFSESSWNDVTMQENDLLLLTFNQTQKQKTPDLPTLMNSGVSSSPDVEPTQKVKPPGPDQLSSGGQYWLSRESHFQQEKENCPLENRKI